MLSLLSQENDVTASCSVAKMMYLLLLQVAKINYLLLRQVQNILVLLLFQVQKYDLPAFLQNQGNLGVYLQIAS